MPDEATALHLPDDGSQEPAPTLAVDPSSTSGAAGHSLPASIGRYRIIRLLGEGGMGAVYEAEQDQPRRHVALKVIKAAWASRELLRRFEQESQALGRLHHPGIAQIYEAGSADTGFGFQPFFAMELIQGTSLIEYADEHKLHTRQRLELMIQVCDAVQHAHQRGIIHRDLKPGNILVDETGQPKILDFGLARITDSDAQATRQTDMGQLLGTLPYMSPEQVLADPASVDTRSDVYALGVILYVLLAGKLPYTLTRHLHEAIRTIQVVDPAPLSTVSRLYRGDVETIVAKALEKDKARRYSSANGLAADIRRYLDDQPISAKPASATYQLQKFARRHKALVAGVAAVFAVLFLGIIASTWEAVRARRAEARTQAESAAAQAVNDFLQKDLLGQASSFNQAGAEGDADPDLKVRTALDRAAQKIGGKFDKQPEVEAAIRDTIGQTYVGLGQYPEARKQLERALELRRRFLGQEDPSTIETMRHLGEVALYQDKYAEAESIDNQALEISRRAFGPEAPETLRCLSSLVQVLVAEEKFTQAEPLAVHAFDSSRRLFGPEHGDTLRALNNLVSVYSFEGKYSQAEELDLQGLEISRRVLGPDHPDTLNWMRGLSYEYGMLGKDSQADEIDMKIFQIESRVLGPEHPQTLTAMYNLTASYHRHGKYEQVEELAGKAVEIKRRLWGAEDRRTANSMNQLADAYAGERKYSQAEALYNEVLEIRRRVQGPPHPDTLRTMSSLAGMYELQGKYAQAGSLRNQLLEIQRRVLGPEHRDTLTTMNGLAWDLVSDPNPRTRRPEEALQLARSAVKGAPAVATNFNTLGLAEYRNNHWDEAIAALNRSVKMDNGTDPGDFFFLALAHWRRGDKAEAERFFEQGVSGTRKGQGSQRECRMFWAEAAKLLGKPGPRPAH